MDIDDVRVGQRVLDTWWPDRLGTIEGITRTRVLVRWLSGKLWRYDFVHLQFLQLVAEVV
jgi:hypothetical protein